MIYNPVVRAIFKRDMRRWFGNPTGYVFLALFVFFSAVALFWPDEFFQNNLANLATLNEWFPVLLLFFVPAITMNIWAGERSHGTDELLLTLPATDTQIILGKYLAAAGIYTVALLFSLPIVLVLTYLGTPDIGLLASNYLGYWLLGLLMLSAGMVGSQLSDNLTVAFIFGGLLCGILLMAEPIIDYLIPFAKNFTQFGPVSLFEEIGRGVLSTSSILLFVGLIAGFLYLNRLLLSRRHWKHQSMAGLHLSIRFACLLVIAVAATGAAANVGKRLDLTQERLHSLSPETERILGEISPERPVYVQAFISEEVPQEYVQTRESLINLLKKIDVEGGEQVQVRIVDTERYSEEAQEAETKFDIRHVTRGGESGGQTRAFEFYLGVAFTSGLEEVVIPFVDKGLSVEYELVRSMRVVASAKRLKVGILDTDVKAFGNFDFQSMRQDPKWAIVRELELQYDVEQVDPTQDYPEDLDALIALMPSSLTQDQMDRLEKHILAGHPTLLFDDPFPAASPGNGPTDPKGGPQNPMMRGQQPPPEQKGDIRGMLVKFNIMWPIDQIVWDSYNPHPQFPFEPEMVFVGANSGSQEAFNSSESTTSGLQELVTIFGGYVRDAGRSEIDFIPLLRTSPLSGNLSESVVFQRHPFFGSKNLNPRRLHRPDPDEKILACRVEGKPSEGDASINLIFVADLDMISEQFFMIRSQGFDEFEFDNVTFLLNCVDQIAGDESFIELRKRRPLHRTLTRLEEDQEVYNKEWLKQKEDAESKAADKLADAQSNLDEAVKKIEESTELDEQSKLIRIKTVQDVEQRKLDVRKKAIEDEKDRAIELAKADRLQGETSIRAFVRVGGLILSPIPAIIVGVLSLLKRRNRERGVVRHEPTQGGVA